jgi:hypothetical protein
MQSQTHIRPLPIFAGHMRTLLASQRTSYLSICPLSLSLSHSSTTPLENSIHMLLTILQRLLKIVLLLLQILNLLDHRLRVLGLLGFDVCGACVYEPLNQIKEEMSVICVPFRIR